MSEAGKSDRCGSSLPRLTGQGDRASGLFDCGFADCQAETGSTGFAGARGITAIEALEDMREVGGIDPLTSIIDCNFDPGVAYCGADIDLRVGRAVLDCIKK